MKPRLSSRRPERHAYPSGAKALGFTGGFTYGLKAVPFKSYLFRGSLGGFLCLKRRGLVHLPFASILVRGVAFVLRWTRFWAAVEP